VWVAPLGEIARHTLSSVPAADARPVPVVTIPEDVYER
jgi:hypothetical protein